MLYDFSQCEQVLAVSIVNYVLKLFSQLYRWMFAVYMPRKSIIVIVNLTHCDSVELLHKGGH